MKNKIKISLIITILFLTLFTTFSFAVIEIAEPNKYDITIENVPKGINKIELMIINKPSGETDLKRDYLSIKDIPVENIKNDILTYTIRRDDNVYTSKDLDFDYCYGIKFISPSNEKIIIVDRETNLLDSTEIFMYDGYNIKRVYDYQTGKETLEEQSYIIKIPSVIFLVVLVVALIFTIRNVFKLLFGGKKKGREDN